MDHQKTNKTKVILTVDTEPSIAGAMDNPAKNPPLIHEPVWGDVNGKSQALGFISDTLSRYNLHATFFVETMHVKHFGKQAMQPYVEYLMKSGHDIQLHMHPVWANFDKSSTSQKTYNDDCSALEESELTTLINEGCNQIKQWCGFRPTAMRTGNFDASLKVYRSMKKAGLSLSSNICVACNNYQEANLQLPGGIEVIEGIHEIPASCFIDSGPIGHGQMRAAQITACSASEIIHLLDQCVEQSVPLLVLVTHPFEFIKKKSFRYNSLRPNRLVQARLEKICGYLGNNKDKLQVTTFKELATELPLQSTSPPTLLGSPIRSVTRATQNFINDRT